jgi:hypothetical protein
MPPLTALALGPSLEGYGTGIEWMVIASVVAPVILLLLIAWYGSRNDV